VITEIAKFSPTTRRNFEECKQIEQSRSIKITASRWQLYRMVCL